MEELNVTLLVLTSGQQQISSYFDEIHVEELQIRN